MTTQAQKICSIATHVGAHFDEIAGAWMLRKFGSTLYPGIEQARLVLLKLVDMEESARKRFERAGTVFVGIGGGAYDEHPANGQPRKEGECAATLVAKSLGREAMPELHDMLEFARKSDLKSVGSRLDIAWLIKLMHQQLPEGQEATIAWVFQALDAEYAYKNRGSALQGTDELTFNNFVSWWLVRQFGADTDEELNIRESTAQEIAKLLGVEEQEELQEMLLFAKTNGHRGKLFQLPHFVRAMQLLQYSLDDIKAWVFRALDAIYADQYEFFITVGGEFRDKAVVEEAPGPHGKPVSIITVESDCPQIQRYARHATSNCAIVIQKQSRGNVQIYSNKAILRGYRLFDLAQMLRLAEQRLKGMIVTNNFKELALEGNTPGAEEWFYHLEGQMLLNGSLTVPDVPPTNILLEKIQRMVRIALNPKAFHPDWERWCAKCECRSSRQNQCPWYPYGLQRCRKIRFEMKRRQSG